MKTTILALLFALSTSCVAHAKPSGDELAAADAPFASAIVKVYSGTCSKAAGLNKGSGVLVSSGGKTYVLTSNHVVQSFLPQDCHQVENGILGKVKAVHVATEWGVGLSLLSIERNIDTALSLDEFSNDGKQSDAVVTAGFPFDMTSGVIHHGGEILSTQSYRHFFPSSESLIELVNVQGEFGMSGGAVFLDTAKRSFLGVLSHQTLLLKEGKPTTVGTMDKNNSVENHVLIIPSRIAKDWITKVLQTSDKYVPKFELLSDQAVATNGFSFQFLSQDDAEAKKIGGHGGDPVGIGGGGDPVGIGGSGDPVGIGGHKDPVGIGGHRDPVGIGGQRDPVGIGGDAGSAGDDASTYGVILIQKLKKKNITASSDDLLTKSWWSDLSKSLLQTDKIYLQVMVRKDKSNNSVTSYQILKVVGIEQFFHRLLENNVYPVFINPDDKNTKAQQPLVQKQAKAALDLIKKLSVIDGLSDPTKDFLAKVNLVASLLKANQASIVSSADIRELMKGDSVQENWNELFNLSFDQTVKLMSALQSLSEAF